MLSTDVRGGYMEVGAHLVEVPLISHNSSSLWVKLPLQRTLTRIELVKIVMQSLPTPTNQSILEQMISLAHFGKQQRILIAGEKSIELMFDLERQRYSHVAVSARRRELRPLLKAA
jgi:hypothetical protein